MVRSLPSLSPFSLDLTVGYVEMGPYYRSITSIASEPSSSSTPTVALEKDEALLKDLETKNTDELKRLDEKLAEAEKNEGETEISEALKARAFYFTKIGDKVRFFLYDG